MSNSDFKLVVRLTLLKLLIRRYIRDNPFELLSAVDKFLNFYKTNNYGRAVLDTYFGKLVGTKDITELQIYLFFHLIILDVEKYVSNKERREAAEHFSQAFLSRTEYRKAIEDKPAKIIKSAKLLLEKADSIEGGINETFIKKYSFVELIPSKMKQDMKSVIITGS